MSKTVVNKVTKVVWDNGFKPDGVNIPSVTSADQGKVLAVDSNGKWVAASPSAPQSELPAYTAADEGKILKVDDQGSLEWADDDNTQYTAGDNISIVNGEISAVDTTYTAGDNIEISAQNVISATDTTYTAGDNVEISADNEISSVNTIVFNAKYFRATDTFQYDATAIAPFLAEVFKNDKRAIVRVQDGNYNIFDIYTLRHYESTNNTAAFSKVNPSIVSANQREIVSANIALSVVNGTGTLTYTSEGVTDLPSGATQGQIPISDGHNGWVAGTIPTELPSVSSADEGKVLKVDANGDWAVGTDNDTTYTAGSNVQINGNVISATDTTYTAGTNVSITNGVISATDTTYTAGSGITITGTSIAADAQLPSYSSTEDGKVLSVDSNGDLEWITPSGGSSYTAGDGIDISAQDVISSPEAVMAKESIAPDFAPMSFYPLPTSADNPSLTDGFVRLYNTKGVLNDDWVYNPYTNSGVVHTGTVYTCIVNSYTSYGTASSGYRMLFIQPNAQGTYGGQVLIKSYRSSDGQTGQDTVNLWQTYTSGGVNFAYGAFDEMHGRTYYEEVSTDLANCVYESDTDALAAFAALYPNNLPTAPEEGDQVWKDGKLQTYTSGDWVDSDPIVEQIANAGGGSAGGIVMPDPSNVIKSMTAINAPSVSYTATADCYVQYKMASTVVNDNCKLNYKVQVRLPQGGTAAVVDQFAFEDEGNIINTFIVTRGIFLKKGWMIEINASNVSYLASSYQVYGIS